MKNNTKMFLILMVMFVLLVPYELELFHENIIVVLFIILSVTLGWYAGIEQEKKRMVKRT